MSCEEVLATVTPSRSPPLYLHCWTLTTIRQSLGPDQPLNDTNGCFLSPQRCKTNALIRENYKFQAHLLSLRANHCRHTLITSVQRRTLIAHTPVLSLSRPEGDVRIVRYKVGQNFLLRVEAVMVRHCGTVLAGFGLSFRTSAGGKPLVNPISSGLCGKIGHFRPVQLPDCRCPPHSLFFLSFPSLFRPASTWADNRRCTPHGLPRHRH